MEALLSHPCGTCSFISLHSLLRLREPILHSRSSLSLHSSLPLPIHLKDTRATSSATDSSLCRTGRSPRRVHALQRAQESRRTASSSTAPSSTSLAGVLPPRRPSSASASSTTPHQWRGDDHHDDGADPAALLHDDVASSSITVLPSKTRAKDGIFLVASDWLM
jgi:hypothetical protein